MDIENARLRAEVEIRDLVSRYADAVIRRDAVAWGETWSLHGEWEILGVHPRGREAVVAQWQTFMDGIPFVIQQPSFGLIDLAASSQDPRTALAKGRWYINEVSRGPRGSSTLVGVYHDRYVHEEGAWRFARRRLDLLYTSKDEHSGTAFPFPDQT